MFYLKCSYQTGYALRAVGYRVMHCYGNFMPYSHGPVSAVKSYPGKEILYHAVAMLARARTVGWNDFMMHKVARHLLTAGRMESPEIDGGPAAQRAIEQSRIPLYLGAEHSGQLYEILDYEDWDTFNYPSIAPFDNLIRVQISQSFPLRTAMHRAFYAADSVYLNGDAFIANHYDLYLDVE